MSRILISYRRETGWALAGRIYDQLIGKFGSENVFIDIDDIKPGADFIHVLENTLANIDAVIPVIDRNWLNIRDDSGKRRLENHADFVRREIVSAINRDIIIIPILEPGATMPSEKDLPEELYPLSKYNAVIVSQKHFSSDIDVVVQILQKIENIIDTSHLGEYSQIAQNMLTNEADLERWASNLDIYYSIWTPEFGTVDGSYSMRAPLLASYENLDLSGEPELVKLRSELVTLINEAPVVDERLKDDKYDQPYDLYLTPELTILTEELRNTVTSLGDFARKNAREMHIRKFRNLDVSKQEIDRWIWNDKWSKAVHVPGLGSQLPFGRWFTMRDSVLKLLERLDFSTDPEMEENRQKLISLINEAPVEKVEDRGKILDLLQTPEMEQLRNKMDARISEQAEAARYKI